MKDIEKLKKQKDLALKRALRQLDKTIYRYNRIIMHSNKDATLCLRIDKKTKKKLKDLSIKKHCSISELIRRLIEKDLSC